MSAKNTNEIKKVAVIGSGVMGSGIAGQVANAGIPVILLDIVPKEGSNRNALAEGAIVKMLKNKPAPFMHKSNAKLITAGNTEDHLDLLADVDWIVEVIIENPKIKCGLYDQLDKVCKPDTIITSNTSTIPLSILTEDMSAERKKRFAITHFFNPPRYMRLLELVEGNDTDKGVVETLRQFCDVTLGKGVVDCNDTPGFIANRIGNMWMLGALNGAFDLGMTVEEADAVSGRPFGIPKTATFGLFDLVGIDLMPMVSQSLADNVGQGDPFMEVHRDQPYITKMIGEGYTGRKGKGGFYRLNKVGGKRVKETRDLQTHEYRAPMKPDLASLKTRSLRDLVEAGDKGSDYAWYILSRGLLYAVQVAEEIATDIVAIDAAMRLGYAWKKGPFELIDDLGAAWFIERLKADGKDIPALLTAVGDGTFYKEEDGKLFFMGYDGTYREVEREEGVLLLSDVKRASKPLLSNASASAWDIGDGVVCLEFHTKMNAIDDDIMAMINDTREMIEGSADHKALVIYNEGDNFSAGVNLTKAVEAGHAKDWDRIEYVVRTGQETYSALKFAGFPTVAAPSGMALGGGCEVLLHTASIQAHSESYIGLVEVGVGFIPGWGGCKELLLRWINNKRRPGGPVPPVVQAFQTIGTAKVSTSAREAMDLLFLTHKDGVTMNRDRLLFDAKTKALALTEGYEAPEKQEEIRLPGIGVKALLDMTTQEYARKGLATPHDVTVSERLAWVLSGGDTDITATMSEDDLIMLERSAFMELAKTPETLARVEHMLETGKPLRN
jgi:3-hydroxyacyl-CoA dehydrogenase